MYPYSNPSLISKGLDIIKGIKWSSVLDGTQKTLGVINQAIPIFYQVKPIVSNAKTLFKIANVINQPTNNNEIKTQETQTPPQQTNTHNSPIFYI